MSKISAEQANNRIIVTNRLSHPEAINERELNAIAGGMMDGLLPVSAEKKKKDILVKCQISEMITLRSYFTGIVTKKMFLDTAIHMVQLVKDCEKNLMNASNLCLDFNYIFLDPRTKSMKCIFWPVVNNHNAQHPAIFFNELPFNLVFNKHEDNSYVSEYLRFFKSSTPFAINSFDRMIHGLAGKEFENGRVPSGSTSYGGEQKSTAVSDDLRTGDTGNIAYDPLKSNKQTSTSVPQKKASCECNKCGKVNSETAKFCVACGNPIEEQKPAMSEKENKATNGTTVLGAGSCGNGTTVLGAYEEDNSPAYPYLLRVKTQDKMFVDKPSFRIGKERQYTDFFISDNSAISRSHADIITRNGKYFIIDRNSTNKTRVDGRIIPPEQEFEIFPDTKIRLADEDFVFTI